MPENEEKIIFTLGTSIRSPQEFVRLLQNWEIEIVADVRRFPTSKFEHFKQENLSDLVGQEGISYCYLGKELGGYRKGGYLAFLTSEDFQEGLAKLEKQAEMKRTAILCAERLPWRCHRRFISGELTKRGWQVIHILDEKRNWVPEGRK